MLLGSRELGIDTARKFCYRDSVLGTSGTQLSIDYSVYQSLPLTEGLQRLSRKAKTNAIGLDGP